MSNVALGSCVTSICLQVLFVRLLSSGTVSKLKKTGRKGQSCKRPSFCFSFLEIRVSVNGKKKYFFWIGRAKLTFEVNISNF